MLLSIVVPVYNEEANILKFYQSVTEVMTKLAYDYELIYVDDGSTDSSSSLLHELADRDKRVKVLLLARNFGHQIALTCGLDYAHGDAVITMDGDMQHPPALIPELVRLWEEGNDVVRTIRDSTEDASWMKAFTSKYYYKVMNIMANVPIVEGGSDFSVSFYFFCFISTFQQLTEEEQGREEGTFKLFLFPFLIFPYLAEK